MTRSKDPEGACPRCRKLIPLVPTADGGSFVLDRHHVVAMERSHGMDAIRTCPGAGSQPASLDDSEDWAWVRPDPAWVPDDSAARRRSDASEPVRIGEVVNSTGFGRVSESVARANEAVRGLSDAMSTQCQARALGCTCLNTGCEGEHHCTCGRRWTGVWGTRAYVQLAPQRPLPLWQRLRLRG